MPADQQKFRTGLLSKYVGWQLTKSGRFLVGGSVLIITLVFGWNLGQLEFDFEFEKFFPKNHPESMQYKEHVAQFGYDNDFLHIILQNERSVFDSSFLAKAVAFEESLSDVKDVIRVYSPLSLQHVVKSPTGLVVFPLLHTDRPAKYRQDSIRIFGNEFYSSAFSRSGDALSIYLNHAHFDDPVRSEALLSSIEHSASKLGLQEIRLVGKLSASGVFVRYIKDDFGKFLGGSLLLSFGLLLLIFRNIKFALLPFFISLLSIVWMFGLMGMLGIKINLLSSLIPPILFFVSMSDAVHLMNAIKKTGHQGKKEQLLSAVQVVWIPTVLTSITTGIGFMSLLWINTEPVQYLGLFAAIGIIFAFVITFTFGLLMASLTSFASGKSIFEVPASLVDSLFEHKKIYIAGCLFLLALLVPGVFQLKINSFLLDDLPKEAQVRKDFEYTDTFMGGSKPYEVRVEVADSALNIWDKKVMDEIVKIEDYLLQEYPIVKVQSPATIMKYLTMANLGGLNQHYHYPESNATYASTLKLKNRIDPKRMNKLVTEDGKVARLIGFFPELGSYETGIRNQKFLAYLDSNVNPRVINYNITGSTYLIDKSHEMLSKDLFYGLITAIGIIAMVLGIYFRSWRLLLISLIPNFIPLLLVAGIMGWLGISVKMTTAIIFTITFGIAVDDTIHMISNYLQQPFTNPKERLRACFKHAGSAVLITSLIMSAGFSLFLFSNFGATYYLGLFIVLSLLVAVLVDLTILPLLLFLVPNYAKKRRQNP
ncbi:MAG: efflux RND transporter permease subunit [Bacteroidota bacterium]